MSKALSNESHAGPASKIARRHLAEALRHTPHRPLVSESDWDMPFPALGIDSHRLFELLALIENDLNITVENEDFTRENMSSPSALADLLAAKVAAKKPTKQKFIHITSEFLPRVSGPQRKISEISANLAEWFDFEVYTCDLARGLAQEEIIDGIPIKRFNVPRMTDLVKLRWRFRELSAYPDLDLETVTNYELPSSGIYRAIQSSGADRIITYFYYSLISQYVIDFFPSKEWIFVPSFFQSPGQKDPNPQWWDPGRVDKLLYFQEQDYQEALDWGIPREKLTLLPFPVDTDRFKPAGEERDPDTLLYVGRITANKGIRAFLQTFKWMLERRPSLRLRLVSDLNSPSTVEREELIKLRAAIEQLNIGDRVEFAGRKDGDDLVGEYSRRRIHILPSVGDCYSFVTLEALACGMNCVNLGSPHYQWQRQSDEGEPLVHLCNSLPEMGETILKLLERGEFHSHRDYIVDRYSWRVLRDAYREFFSK